MVTGSGHGLECQSNRQSVFPEIRNVRSETEQSLILTSAALDQCQKVTFRKTGFENEVNK